MQPDFEILPDEDLPVPDLPEQEPHARFSARWLFHVATGLVVLIAIIASSPLWLPTATTLWQRIFPGPNIYVQNGSTLEALATGNGHVVWQVKGISSLASAFLADGVIYAATASADNAIVAVRASDGRVLWRVATDTTFNYAPVAVADHRIYFTRDLQLVALDAASGTIAWQAPISDGQAIQGVQAAYGGGQVLFCENRAGDNPQVVTLHMLSRSADTGRIRWQKTLNTMGNFAGICYRLKDLILLMNTASADNSLGLSVFDAQQGRPLWQRTINGIIAGFDENTVYVNQGADALLAAYNLNDGKQRWAIPLSSFHVAAFTNLSVTSTAENGQYGTTPSGSIVVDTGVELDGVASATGRILWRNEQVGNVLMGPIAVGPRHIIYAAVQRDVRLLAINGASGTIAWNAALPSALFPRIRHCNPLSFSGKMLFSLAMAAIWLPLILMGALSAGN